MNMKVVLSFLLVFVFLAEASPSLAKPQYFTSLNTVYGNGSCETCHINDNSRQRTPYGILFENQPDHAADPGAALRAIGAPPTGIPTLTPAATLTVSATATPTAVTTVSATATPAAPGFGIVLSLIGLFVCSLLVKRKNK